MELFDLINIHVDCKDNKGVKVFYQNELFKSRIIILESNGIIPTCQMETFVMFLVIKGQITLHKNNEMTIVKENQLFISEPSYLSMESETGARILGIQIMQKQGN